MPLTKIVCFQMIKVAKLVLIWYWHFTLYQCNSHFKLNTENCALNTRHQALLHHCVVYYIHKYQLWKILNGAHIESLDVEDSSTGTKISEQKEERKKCVMCHVSCVIWLMSFFMCLVSYVMGHLSHVTWPPLSAASAAAGGFTF